MIVRYAVPLAWSEGRYQPLQSVRIFRKRSRRTAAQ